MLPRGMEGRALTTLALGGLLFLDPMQLERERGGGGGGERAKPSPGSDAHTPTRECVRDRGGASER